jgi:1-acyl-sn-glycerol-3-phosphate acyltransferase
MGRAQTLTMDRLISLARLSVGFVGMALLSLLFAPVMVLVFPWRRLRLELFNVYGKVTGRMIIFLAGVRPRVTGGWRLKQTYPAVYIGNHTSALDAFVSFWISPMGATGVVKREVALIPFFGQVYWLSGNLLINRKDKAGAVQVLKDVVDFVRDFHLGFWIMPEGTRSKDGRLCAFKTGFVHLAIDMGLPVIPIVTHGAHKNWEKGTFRFKPMDLDIEVLAPIDTSGWTHEGAQAHARDVHDLFAAALREDQKPLPQAAVVVESAAPASPAAPALVPALG